MKTTNSGKWELTATKSGATRTEYFRTRKAAEAAAFEMMGWGWATTVVAA